MTYRSRGAFNFDIPAIMTIFEDYCRNMNRLIYIALCLTTALSCTRVREARSVKRAPVKVETQVAMASPDRGTATWIGEITSSKSTTLTAPFPGTLERLPIKKGEKLSAGQAVAVVRSEQVESAARIARATYSQARDAYDRMNMVYKEGGVSELQMVDIRTSLDKAEAAKAAAERALADCTLKAPFKGMVTEVFVERGVHVNALQPIASIHDMGGLSIRISVHENEIGSLLEGMVAKVDIPALGKEGLDATLTGKDMLSSPLSHTYACTLYFDDDPAGLMPGMSVKVHIQRKGGSSLIVPALAVQMDGEGKYVWLNDKGIVRKARITVGGFSGNGVIVTGGLGADDRVIVKGFQKVSSGMKVTE